MKKRFPGAGNNFGTRARPARLVLAFISILLLSALSQTSAQQRFSRRYPARQNVRLQLVNLFGTVTVEAWNRSEIKISANMDSPTARFTPRMDDNGMLIDVAGDNRGRGDIGDVNFTINVPVNSTVDIETKRGNISINGVEGSMVRAHISLGGDINLTSIRATEVFAQNTMGDILFDGELRAGGSYLFKTTEGNISVRIPTNSEFRLEATAPLSRYIDLGAFSNRGANSISDGRKCVGNIGNARASLQILNQRGRIAFLHR
ncbi:MAG TPA: DUF4097 family beta strand repeat-containing protein [Pyrinomonadaceae bacterium]